MSKITLVNITKRFEERSVLRNLSLTFSEKQTSVLIGPSGCGKSTLLKILVGLIKPTTGHVYYNQDELNDQNVDRLRLQIGYVIQEGGLFPHLNVLKNITLQANFLGYEKSLIRDRLDFLIDLVQLPSVLLTLHPLDLSVGQRQRISLVRALFLDPPCIFLDEPFAALDPITRHELQIQLKNIFLQLKKSVILVTHDMKEALFFGDEIVLMQKGEVIQQGSYQDLALHPANPYVKTFLQQDPILLERVFL